MTDLSTVRAAQQAASLASRLPATPARVLDAGSGRGDLALVLRDRGYDVTGIDIDPDAVEVATSAGAPVALADIATYDDEPFDVVLFSLSLHHVADLDASVARAWELLRPGGLLIADEFAWERADDATATWFHDTAVVLHEAGLLGSHELTVVDDPLQWWVHRHRDEHPMHPGSAMADAIARRFGDVALDRGPYLYRYLSGWLPDDARGAGLFAVLEEIERRRIAGGRLTPIGLQLLTRRS